MAKIREVGIAWRMLVVVAACILVLGVAFAWSRALFPLLAGFLLAYLTHPLANFFERHKLPRILGFLFILLIFVALAGLVFFVFVPAMVNELAVLADKLPSWQEVMDKRVGSLLAEIKAQYPKAYLMLEEKGRAWIDENLPSIAQRLVTWLAMTIGSAASLAGVLLNMVLIPVIAAYLTIDFHRFIDALRRMIPRPVVGAVDAVVRDVHSVLSSFVRGQLLVALALTLMYTVGLLIVGAPLAMVIGPLAGLLSLVPYLGLVVGAGISLILTAIEHQDFVHPIGVLVVFVIAQNIEGWWLTPRLLGKSVGLHPVWVLVALLLGGELFGLPGVVVAVPMAAALGVIIARAVDAYHKSTFYLGTGSVASTRAEEEKHD